MLTAFRRHGGRRRGGTLREACFRPAEGERLVLETGRAPGGERAVRRYWDLLFPARHDDWPVREAAEKVRRLVKRAVERRLVADVPQGAFLSGGIDSSTVVAVMADLVGADQIKTYSVGFDDRLFDENEYARLVARRLGTDHHEARIGDRALVGALPEITELLMSRTRSAESWHEGAHAQVSAPRLDGFP